MLVVFRTPSAPRGCHVSGRFPNLCQVVSRIRTLHIDYGMLWDIMKVDYFYLPNTCKSPPIAENRLLRTSEDTKPADFLYASIQSEAISRWAVLPILAR